MTPSDRNKSPDFFENHSLDPVRVATGGGPEEEAPVPKKKAGFYLSEALLDRFNRQFYQLKLAGVAVVNKSALVELALTFALDDIEKGQQSKILEMMK
jgi:hypothetical protein